MKSVDIELQPKVFAICQTASLSLPKLYFFLCASDQEFQRYDRSQKCYFFEENHHYKWGRNNVDDDSVAAFHCSPCLIFITCEILSKQIFFSPRCTSLNEIFLSFFFLFLFVSFNGGYFCSFLVLLQIFSNWKDSWRGPLKMDSIYSAVVLERNLKGSSTEKTMMHRNLKTQRFRNIVSTATKKGQKWDETEKQKSWRSFLFFVAVEKGSRKQFHDEQ